MSIKYYHLAKDEELPEEFCAIRDKVGEPNSYVFYVPESEVGPTGMPKIDKLFYNGTHTTVKWSDGTKTTVNATGDDEFNKEVGLAMCIARKYFEDNGRCDTPRAEFLKTIENANHPAPKIDQKKKSSYEWVRFDPKNSTPFFVLSNRLRKH